MLLDNRLPTFPPKNTKPVRLLETSGSDHPMTWRHTLEKLNDQLHRCENPNTRTKEQVVLKNK